ncbi:methyltransferase domain-containing protein [Streptomyces sp. NPDC002851]
MTAPEAADTAAYTHGHHPSVLRSHTWRTAENSAAYLLGSLKPHMRILDLGCGPGTITADLAARVPQGRVVGVDADPGVLERARATAAERSLDNVEFETSDALALPYEDDTFCVAHAHQVLQHLSDPVGALRELRRVVRPGGFVAVRDADYAAMTWSPAAPGLDDWVRLYREVARANGGEPDAGRYLKSWALEAGFTDITATASAWCYSTEEERAWWSDLWAERTTASRYGRIAVSGGHTTPDGLNTIAEAWREWGSCPDGWFAVLNAEILCRV